MDGVSGYSAVTSWALFGAACAAGAYYYWPKEKRRPDRPSTAAERRRRNEPEARASQNRRVTPERPSDDDGKNVQAEAGSQSGSDAPRQRKVQAKKPAQPQLAPSVEVQDNEPEEADTSTKQWAEQMVQARKGHDIARPKSKEQRVRTVKQNTAQDTPEPSSRSSQGGAEADDDLSPVTSPALNAGEVSDMLEPVAPGPSTLRLTAPTKPQKQKVAKQIKEEATETKKQRQNRKKVEERRLEREAEEKERKALEERQRRTARQARGEPAKNGIPVSKPPATNAWAATKAAPNNDGPVIVNGSQNAPLLDTFDAESTSSSNGGLEASTAATSTTSGGSAQWGDELPSEEEQMAQAMKQSEDDSGWTTVAQPKKQKKKGESDEHTPTTSILSNKANVERAKTTANGKPQGFQALEVEYEQRTDADPNDASNWDA